MTRVCTRTWFALRAMRHRYMPHLFARASPQSSPAGAGKKARGSPLASYGNDDGNVVDTSFEVTLDRTQGRTTGLKMKKGADGLGAAVDEVKPGMQASEYPAIKPGVRITYEHEHQHQHNRRSETKHSAAVQNEAQFGRTACCCWTGLLAACQLAWHDTVVALAGY